MLHFIRQPYLIKALLLLLWMIPLSLSSQNIVEVDYAATYQYTIVKDTNSLAYFSPVEFLLLRHGDESRFVSANRHFNDSMSANYTKAHPEMINPRTQEEMQAAADAFSLERENWSKPVYGEHLVSKNFSTNVFFNKLVFAFPFQHLEELLLKDWNILPQTDKIAGLTCNVATIGYGGRNYTAWFTLDIPIPDGPYVFSGLPGLIVKISDERKWYTFELTEFKAGPTQRFWKADFFNPFSRKISRKEYVDKTVKMMKNPSIPGATDLSEEFLIELKERYQSKFHLLLEQE